MTDQLAPNSLTSLSGDNNPAPISTVGHQFLFRLTREIKDINTTNDFAEYLNTLLKWKDSIDKLTIHVKTKIEELLKLQGTKTTAKGSLELKTENYILKARPTRTGVDPKKLEALLRARKIDTGIAMDMEIKFTVNADKLAYCLAEGVLNEQDLEQCEYETSYAVLPPIKL